MAVTAGEAVDLMLSGEGHAQVLVVRLIHGDPNPAGLGYRDERDGISRGEDRSSFITAFLIGP